MTKKQNGIMTRKIGMAVLDHMHKTFSKKFLKEFFLSISYECILFTITSFQLIAPQP